MREIRDRYGLTRSRREVVELAATGLEHREIAKRLGKSHKTVTWHVNQLLAQTNSRKLVEALYKLGAIRLPWEESVNGSN